MIRALGCLVLSVLCLHATAACHALAQIRRPRTKRRKSPTSFSSWPMTWAGRTPAAWAAPFTNAQPRPPGRVRHALHLRLCGGAHLLADQGQHLDRQVSGAHGHYGLVRRRRARASCCRRRTSITCRAKSSPLRRHLKNGGLRDGPYRQVAPGGRGLRAHPASASTSTWAARRRARPRATSAPSRTPPCRTARPARS